MTDLALHRLGGEGPDILFIHGFGADRLGWLAVAPQLFDEASVWAVEYAGHGTAGNDAGDGAPATIAAAIADEIGDRLTRPLVVGHSLGGTLALHLAAAMPEGLAGLVLLAPAALAASIDDSFIAAIPELDDPDEALDVLRRLVCREILITPRMAGAVVAGLSPPGRRAALRQIAGALETSAPPPFPPSVPFEVIWGSEDEILAPPDPALPDMQLVDGVGHMPHIEAAGDVIAAIRRGLGTAA
jgi:pimeloyl-ACP methyl ester carboxylesterase